MISLGALDDLHILSDNLDELAIQWRGCMRSRGWTAVARAAKAVAAIAVHSDLSNGEGFGQSGTGGVAGSGGAFVCVCL